jgi:hypothetical protein
VRRRTQRRVVSALVRVSFFSLALLVCRAPVSAADHTINTIICREEISSARREVLAARLSAITGLNVEFDENGALRLTREDAHEGSGTARNLLIKALNGRRVLILEDASDRQDVVFARVVPGRFKHHASEMPPTFVVLIDFADFDHLLGDDAALKAFDVGWAFLHELDHVVNDYADGASLNETGECEDHLNVMRRELNLPTRADYFFTFFPDAERSDFRTRFVRLAFDQADALTKKRHRYWVMWDATVVGGLSSQIAAAR